MAAPYSTWDEEDRFWRDDFPSRPYAAGRTYEEFRPAYRYGYESATHYMGRRWDEVEPDLRTGWDKFESKGPGGAAWEDIKDAVKNAWDRITGKHDLDAEKMSESEVERLSRGGTPR
jgi:hypothetical protein